MGYALIVSGGTDGRYTISLDIGEAERAALVARFTSQYDLAQAKLAAAEAELTTKTTALDEATLTYNEATTAYIELLRGEVVGGAPEELAAIFTEYQEAQAAYIGARTAHAAALANRNALSFSASRLANSLAAWQAQVLTETRQAWCADLTEDATGYVATMEIPGESELILIAPGGRVPVLATDGYLRSRGLMAPWQAYFNAAILPGWQKFKPTYRWGTITALDVDADTATVSLAEARSSAQMLLVNQATTLIGIPVVYMECNADAFQIGDSVVVEFQGKDWAAPRVIGFVDNPRQCIAWPIVSVPALHRFVVTSEAVPTKFFFYSIEAVGSACYPEGFGSHSAQPSLPSGSAIDSMPIQALEIYYGTATFVGEQPLFSISVISSPSPYVIGYQNHFFPLANGINSSLSAVAASYPPYPGGPEATSYEVQATFPQKITKWFTPVTSFSLSEYDNSDLENPCQVIATDIYERFSSVPFSLPSNDETTDKLGLTDTGAVPIAYLASLYTTTVIHDGPFYELLEDPVLHVTYHGPDGDITAEYKRVGADFRKKAVL